MGQAAGDLERFTLCRSSSWAFQHAAGMEQFLTFLIAINKKAICFTRYAALLLPLSSRLSQVLLQRYLRY